MHHGMNGAAAQQTESSYQRSALAAVSAPVTRLEGAHNAIESAIESLRERVGILSSRMGNVLQPPCPSETAVNGSKDPGRSSSPAVESAERLAARVRGVEQMVIDLLERLEA